ncbi:unnamed protein product [Penicillium manginii]
MNSSREKAASALFIAAANGHLDVLKELKSCHQNMNKPNWQGTTPLMQACQNGHTEVATFLINEGEDVSASNSTGYTALYMAAEIGSLELVQLLREHDAIVDERESSYLARGSRQKSKYSACSDIASNVVPPPHLPKHRDQNPVRMWNPTRIHECGPGSSITGGLNIRDPGNLNRSLGKEIGLVGRIEEFRYWLGTFP